MQGVEAGGLLRPAVEPRHLLGAAGAGVRAARPEGAALRRVQRVGKLGLAALGGGERPAHHRSAVGEQLGVGVTVGIYL